MGTGVAQSAMGAMPGHPELSSRLVLTLGAGSDARDNFGGYIYSREGEARLTRDLVPRILLKSVPVVPRPSRMNAPAEFKYLAFLSYSSKKRRIATRLQRYLEAYRVPNPLVGLTTRQGKIPRRLGTIFRDRTDVASAPSLAMEIEKALATSFALVVICSPETANPSSWVNREIEAFRRLRPDGPIFPVVVEGEPAECFPPALTMQILGDGSRAERPEPLAADLRPDGDGLVDGRLKLIAGLLGVDFDGLRRRHEIAARRRRAILATIGVIYIGTISAIGIGLIIQTIYLSRTNSRAISEIVRTLIRDERYDVAQLLSIVSLPPTGSLLGAETSAEAEAIAAASRNLLRADFPVHHTNIWAMAVEPRGQHIALTAANNGEVALVDIGTGEVLFRDKVFGFAAIGVAFSPDGLLAAAGGMNELIIFDVTNRRVRQRSRIPDLDLRALAFIPGTNSLIVGGIGGAFLVDATGNIPNRQIVDSGHKVMAVAVSPEGTLGLVGTYEGRLVELSLPDGGVIAERTDAGTVTSALFDNLADQWITTRALSPIATFWTRYRIQPVKSINIGESASRFTLDSSHRTIVSGHWDDTIRLTDISTAAQLGVIRNDSWLDGVAVLLDGTLLTADHNGHLRHWSRPDSGLDANVLPQGAPGPGALALSQDGTLVAAGSPDGTISVRDANLTSLSRKLPLKQDCVGPPDEQSQCGVVNIAISPANSKIAYVNARGDLIVIDLKDDVELWRSSRTNFTALAFADDEQLASGSNIGKLSLWNASTGALIAESGLPRTSAIKRLTFDPKGKTALIAAGPELVTWEPSSGTIVSHELWRHARTILSVAWSADGRTIATGGASDGVLLGSSATMHTTRLVPSFGADWVYGVALSAKGRFVAIGTSRGDLSLVDTETGVEINHRVATVTGGAQPAVIDVALTTDGDQVYYNTSSGITATWSVPIIKKNTFQETCQRLPTGRHSFTEAEMHEFSFLDQDSKWPCLRHGLLSLEYWKSKIDKLRVLQSID
jgi:WD40 repeat protein